MGVVERVRKWWNVSRHLRRVGPRLRSRFGPEEWYGPGRVRATVLSCRLSPRYLEYALALFCSQRDFVEYLREAAHAEEPYAVPGAAAYRARPQVVSPGQPPSEEELTARYRALRAEVAARYNGGSSRFLTRLPNRFEPAWTSVENDHATGSKALLP